VKRTKALYIFLLTVIFLAFALLITAKLAGANADTVIQEITTEAGPMRAAAFVALIYQQCRTGQGCAVIEPTPAQPCDSNPDWPYCP
jgi:hypothetical protein